MLIREVRSSDFEDVVATFLSFFPEVEADPSFGLVLYRQKPSVEDERNWFSRVMDGIQEGNTIMMVAEVNSHVIGWCDVRRVVPKSPADHRGEFGICVKKELRGQGIGEALMRAILERCRGRFEVVELGVFTNNQRAKKLYEKFGFKKYGTREYSIKRGGGYFAEDLMYLKL
jgi:ribosomal protein S18 acetylase RimI-like enzyme